MAGTTLGAGRLSACVALLWEWVAGELPTGAVVVGLMWPLLSWMRMAGGLATAAVVAECVVGVVAWKGQRGQWLVDSEVVAGPGAL